MEKLLAALQVNEETYENIIFQQWFNWSNTQGKDQQEVQSLLANAALFNWWRMEYTQFERDFLFEVAPYKGQISPKDAYLLYVKNIHKIQLYYSKPLIDNAKKTSINNE
ncbi:hypothetical protein BFP77_08200 [Maribacter sp. 4U21]|uniref:hypothetical protein n=1 Tax=Maribacter sp. 4U21 TaxID=1889779 RepID=UPI000C14AC37|nr:hypothetical protein [Maribacter sp. 4U21]PIB28888.1 hypothetical protein BFP77_08200 [Maribacter sp. 4U21]